MEVARVFTLPLLLRLPSNWDILRSCGVVLDALG